MKKTFLNLLKIALPIFLFLQVGLVNGQGFITWNSYTNNQTTPITGNYPGGGTVEVSSTGTGNNHKFFNPSVFANLNNPAANQTFGTSGSYNVTPLKSLTFTFSTPVIINELNIADIDRSINWNDTFTFSNVTFTSVSGANCTFTLTGASPTGNTGNNNEEYAQWLTSTSPISSFSIDFAIIANVTAADLYYSIKVTNACAAFNTAPALSATQVTAACPDNTVNLNSLVTSTAPTGGTLKWYTDAARTTELATPTAVDVSGTYYAFYVNTTNTCYSPASAAVNVTANCPLNLAPTVCPAFSFDLATITNTPPAGYTKTYHSGTPATDANKITNSVITASGTYYISSFLSAENTYGPTSRPIVVTITDCCAVQSAPLFDNN